MGRHPCPWGIATCLVGLWGSMAPCFHPSTLLPYPHPHPAPSPDCRPRPHTHTHTHQPSHQEFVCDLVMRRHNRDELLTEPLVIYSVLTAVGVGPVLAGPDTYTFRWSVETPEDVPFPYLHLRLLATEG